METFPYYYPLFGKPMDSPYKGPVKGYHWLRRKLTLRQFPCSQLWKNTSKGHFVSNINHYSDVRISTILTIASQITSLTIVYLTVYSDADQINHQSSVSLAFVWGIHRKMFPFDDVIMWISITWVVPKSEICDWTFIGCKRPLTARPLVSRGLRQSKVATLVGVFKVAVHRGRCNEKSHESRDWKLFHTTNKESNVD